MSVGSAALVAIIQLEGCVQHLSSYQVQRKLVDEYCVRHPTLGLRLHLPSDQEQRELLYRHLLYDDLREIMFCFVEKIGERNDSVLIIVNASCLRSHAAHSWPKHKPYPSFCMAVSPCIISRLQLLILSMSTYRSCRLTYSYLHVHSSA